MRGGSHARSGRARRTRTWGRVTLCALAAGAGGAIALPAGSPAGESSQATPGPVAQIAVGVFHSCAVLADANVRCWGYNGDGQVGYGNTNIVGDDETPGSVGPVSLGAGRTVRTVTAGDYHSCALLDNGSVRCWGFAFEGQLGYGNPRNNIGDNEVPASVGPVNLGAGRTATAITAGARHTCAVLDDGKLRCWGQADSGQLGYPNLGNTTTVGDPSMREPVDFGGGRTARAITAGNAHTCAILDDGSVRCWGLGSNGQLGYGDTTAVSDPSTVGPVDLGAGRTARAITAGGAHTCAVLDDGSVRCWGLSDTGQLGYGNTNTIGNNETPGSVAPVNLGSDRRAEAISAGDAHTCAALDDGRVRCWGSGDSGRLGYGNTDTIGDNESPAAVGPVDVGAGRAAVAIAAGQAHTCARLDTGSVRCWGFAHPGRLGYCNANKIGDDETPAAAGPVELGEPGRPGAQCAAGPSPTAEPTPAPGPGPGPTDQPGTPGTPGGEDPYDVATDPLELEKQRKRAYRRCVRAAKQRGKRRARKRARKACRKRYGRARPGRVAKLRAKAIGRRRIVLSFRAAGSDGDNPPAARTYRIKQSSRPIRSARAFRRAHALCNGTCRFGVTAVGEKITLTVTRLERRRTYHYAVAARDNITGRPGPRSKSRKARTR